MPEVITITHLALAVALVLGVIAAWPVRALAQVRKDMESALKAQDKEVTARLAAQDERISTTLVAVHAALEDVRRNQEGLHTMQGLVLEIREGLATARRAHPPDQHPRTERELEKINARLDDFEAKLDEVLGQKFHRVNPLPGRN